MILHPRVKEITESLVLTAIIQGFGTVKEIEEKTLFSRWIVDRCLESLLAQGEIVKRPRGEERGGYIYSIF